MSVKRTTFYFCAVLLFAITAAFPHHAVAQAAPATPAKDTVKKVKQTVKIEKDTLRLYVGQLVRLTAKAVPDAKVFHWDARTSIPVIAAIGPPVSSNAYDSVTLVLGRKPDLTVIEVRVNDAYDRCIVVVTPKVYVNKLQITRDTIQLYTGDSAVVTSRIFPANTSDKTLAWTTVGGHARVQATKDSVTRVFAAAQADTSLLVVSALDESNVRDTAVIITRHRPVTNFTLDHDTIRFDIGRTDTLRATVLPLNATDRNVKWTLASGAAKVVPMDSVGLAVELLAATAADTALVVAEVADGLMDSCVVITIDPNATASTEIDPTVAIRPTDGGVMVHADRSVPLAVYSVTGALIRRERLAPGDRFVPLRRGIYIVSLDRTRWKIFVR